MKRPVRMFNASGIEAFRACLEKARGGSECNIPLLIANPELSTPITPAVEIEIRPFASRLDAGEHLFAALAPAEAAGIDVATNVGMWSWLGAAWFELLLPEMHRPGYPGEDARWILQPDAYDRYYRHLLATPYRIVRGSEDASIDAMAVLAGPVGQPGQVAESLVANRKVITTPALLRAATDLYYDRDTRLIKKKAGDKSPGSARRFVKVQAQFSATYDLNQLSAKEVLDLFPLEFATFRTDS